jgi:hypothetical protein
VEKSESEGAGLGACGQKKPEMERGSVVLAFNHFAKLYDRLKF